MCAQMDNAKAWRGVTRLLCTFRARDGVKCLVECFVAGVSNCDVATMGALVVEHFAVAAVPDGEESLVAVSWHLAGTLT